MGEELGLTAQKLTAWLNGGWTVGKKFVPYEKDGQVLAEIDDTVRRGLMRLADAEAPEAAMAAAGHWRSQRRSGRADRRAVAPVRPAAARPRTAPARPDRGARCPRCGA